MEAGLWGAPPQARAAGPQEPELPWEEGNTRAPGPGIWAHPTSRGPRGWAPPVLPWALLRGDGGGPEPGGRQCWKDNGFLVPLEPRAQSLVPAGELRARLAEAAWVSGQGCGRHPLRATCRASWCLGSWSPEKPPEAFGTEASTLAGLAGAPGGVAGPSATSGSGPVTLGKVPPRAQHRAPPGQPEMVARRGPGHCRLPAGLGGQRSLCRGSEAALWHRRWHVPACAHASHERLRGTGHGHVGVPAHGRAALQVPPRDAVWKKRLTAEGPGVAGTALGPQRRPVGQWGTPGAGTLLRGRRVGGHDARPRTQGPRMRPHTCAPCEPAAALYRSQERGAPVVRRRLRFQGRKGKPSRAGGLGPGGPPAGSLAAPHGDPGGRGCWTVSPGWSRAV